MTPTPEEVSSRQFHAADGVADWRIAGDGARARFHTGSFTAGVHLVEAIGRIAGAANHDPEVDLRFDHVDVRLWTVEVPGLSQRDIDVARAISSAARELGLDAQPATVQSMQVTIDTVSPEAIMPFWQAALGYRAFGEDDVLDPFGYGPWFHFQQIDEPREQRGRIHVDVYVPQERAQARVEAAVRAGGRVVNDAFAPAWWTLADPDGNLVDIAPWPDAH